MTILTDIMKTLVEVQLTAKMQKQIYFHFGYIKELNETLQQKAQSPDFFDKRFPIVWLMQPFTIQRGEIGNFGLIENARIFLIEKTDVTYKAEQRVENVFKPTLYPMYENLIELMKVEPKIFFKGVHRVTDRYYWGEGQQSVLNDAFDCMELYSISMKLKNIC